MKAMKHLQMNQSLTPFGSSFRNMTNYVWLLSAAALTILAGISAACFAQGVVVAPRQGQGKSLAGVIKPYFDNHEIAGAVVLIADRDRVIDREVTGYANLAGQRPMKEDDLFWIASMSKAMTASAVMMLVDEGKLSLDDPIEKYLPEFKNQMVSLAPGPESAASLPSASGSPAGVSALPKLEPLKHPITIRELLSHTAGLPFSSKRETPALDLLPLRAAVESYAAEPLQSQPGEKYSYSNEGINTAGRIVEVVSGMPFEEFMQKRLFIPLGMNDATFWPTNEQLKRLAKSYESGALREVPIDQLTYPLSDRTRRYPIPAGGLFSTADDVLRFCQMMLNDGIFEGKRYLSQQSIRMITNKETGDGVGKPYGLGWNVGYGFYEHSGAYKTDMKVDVKRGLIVVLMVQHANDWNLDERQRLMEALEQTAVPAESGAIPDLQSQMVSPNGIATSAKISADEQAGIDEDISRHLGDVTADPGPRANLSASMSPAAVHAAMRIVADWELPHAQPYLTQNWTWSVLDTGFMAASRELHDPKFSNAMLAMAENFHWELGVEDPADRGWPDNNDQALAQTYLELYFLDPTARKIAPTKKAFDTLFEAKMPPVPEGQFPIWWQWCDTLFMGPAAWARLAAATHDPKYLEYLDKRWWETSDALYDTRYHLFYRDKTFIDRKGPAGKPIFWSRGNGWVMGGLARALEYMPKDYPGREKYEAQLREMAAEFAAIQDPKDGLWHSDLLDAADYPQPEISGSSLITFGLAWGVNHGLLDRATYTPIVARAWRGMIDEIYADGRLGNIQQTGGAPNYYLPSSSYNYGVGGFLLAGEQVAKFSKNLEH
jgi:CubicO group peptidase (beta-lactamase class C family)